MRTIECTKVSRKWRVATGAFLLTVTAMAGLTARGEDRPGYLDVVSPTSQRPPKENIAARGDVLELDRAMMAVYSRALANYKKNLRDESPIILALFTGAGGRFILYRPGAEPLEAPPVPIEYQLAKSCGHSTMAVYQLVAPYLSDPDDQSWRESMQIALIQNRTALEHLNALQIDPDARKVFSGVLNHNMAFMNQCLSKRTFTFEELEKFTRGFTENYAEELIWIAANTQVTHWMSVVDKWKSLLGDDWDKTYAATNTLYVTRQNNILFTVLAQYMGADAINDRLLLFETTEFTTTPEQMLDLLTRIVADRALGKVFFNNYYLMDYELLGSGARRAIQEQTVKRKMEPLMPPLVPFNSHEWPWRTDPSSGSGPATLEQVQAEAPYAHSR